MKKVVLVIAMTVVLGIAGTAIAQAEVSDGVAIVKNSNVVTNPLQTNDVTAGDTQEATIETGEAAGGSRNWAVAANVPITLVGGGPSSSYFEGQGYNASSGSSYFTGQSYSSNPTNISNGDMCATANGGGNANTGNNTLNQTVKQKNVIKQKTKELENN